MSSTLCMSVSSSLRHAACACTSVRLAEKSNLIFSVHSIPSSRRPRLASGYSINTHSGFSRSARMGAAARAHGGTDLFRGTHMSTIQKHREPSTEEIHRYCASLGEGDGEDPHTHKRPQAYRRRRPSGPGTHGRPERKVCQLCRQVAETLDEVLADCGDGVLRGLRVASVVPYPNASRLLVTVAPVDGRMAPDAGPKVVMEHLERASGHLRYEIATAVTRKRAPLLVYWLAEPVLAEA